MAKESYRGKPILTNEFTYVDRNKMASKKEYEKVIQLLTEAEAINLNDNDDEWEDVDDENDNDDDENEEEDEQDQVRVYTSQG